MFSMGAPCTNKPGWFRKEPSPRKVRGGRLRLINHPNDNIHWSAGITSFRQAAVQRVLAAEGTMFKMHNVQETCGAAALLRRVTALSAVLMGKALPHFRVFSI